MKDPVSLHKYLYDNANPVSNSDPTGYSALVGGITAGGIMSDAEARHNTAVMKIFAKLMVKLNAINVSIFKLTIQATLVTVILSGDGNIQSIIHAIKGNIEKAIQKIKNEFNKGNSSANGPERNWNKPSTGYLKKELAKLGTDPHSLKREYLGKDAPIAHYDLMVDKSTGIVGIFDKAGNLVEETYYIIN